MMGGRMEQWKRTFWAVWVAEFIAIAGFATTTPIIAYYLASLGLGDEAALKFWTGAAHTGASLAMAIFAPIWGGLADRVGRKPMLMRAMFGGSLLIGLLSLTTEPWQVALLRTVQGSVTGTVAAANVFTASLVPEKETGYRLGLMQMAVYLGNSLGPIIGSSLAVHTGYRGNFLVTSGLLMAAGLVIIVFAKEEFAPKPSTGSLVSRILPDFSPLVRTPALLPLLAVVFLFQFANSVVAPMLPLYIRSVVATEAQATMMSGTIITTTGVAGALGAVLIGRISIRAGSARTLILSMAGAFLFYLPQGFVRSPWILLALRFGSGLCLGGTMPNVNALIARLCERGKQGATYGLSASISSAGMALGPALGTVMALGAGYSSIFFITTAILGGVGIMVAINTRAGRLAGPERSVERA